MQNERSLRAILAHNVRATRRAKGWSQEDFANRSDFDRTYISGIERGVRNPTLGALARIALALDVSVADLLSESEDG